MCPPHGPTAQVSAQYSQLEDDWKSAQDTAKEDISSMVFNTFIWCQVGGA